MSISNRPETSNIPQKAFMKKNSEAAAAFNKRHDYKEAFILKQSEHAGYTHPKASILINTLKEFTDKISTPEIPAFIIYPLPEEKDQHETRKKEYALINFAASAALLTKELLEDPFCSEKNILALNDVLMTAIRLKDEPTLNTMQEFLKKEAEFHTNIEPYRFLRRIRASKFSKYLGDFANNAEKIFDLFFSLSMTAGLLVILTAPEAVVPALVFLACAASAGLLQINFLILKGLFHRSEIKESANQLSRDAHNIAEKLTPEAYKKNQSSSSPKLADCFSGLFTRKTSEKKPAAPAPELKATISAV